jgi:hypothetical protein
MALYCLRICVEALAEVHRRRTVSVVTAVLNCTSLALAMLLLCMDLVWMVVSLAILALNTIAFVAARATLLDYAHRTAVFAAVVDLANASSCSSVLAQLNDLSPVALTWMQTAVYHT